MYGKTGDTHPRNYAMKKIEAHVGRSISDRTRLRLMGSREGTYSGTGGLVYPKFDDPRLTHLNPPSPFLNRGGGGLISYPIVKSTQTGRHE